MPAKKSKPKPKTAANKRASGGRSASPCSAFDRGWITGAIWGVAELLRTHGSEVEAKDMLRAVANREEILKYADPIDLAEIETYPHVFQILEPNVIGEARADNASSPQNQTP